MMWSALAQGEAQCQNTGIDGLRHGNSQFRHDFSLRHYDQSSEKNCKLLKAKGTMKSRRDRRSGEYLRQSPSQLQSLTRGCWHLGRALVFVTEHCDLPYMVRPEGTPCTCFPVRLDFSAWIPNYDLG